jgi:hypothetical protein
LAERSGGEGHPTGWAGFIVPVALQGVAILRRSRAAGRRWRRPGLPVTATARPLAAPNFPQTAGEPGQADCGHGLVGLPHHGAAARMDDVAPYGLHYSEPGSRAVRPDGVVWLRSEAV